MRRSCPPSSRCLPLTPVASRCTPWSPMVARGLTSFPCVFGLSAEVLLWASLLSFTNFNRGHPPASLFPKQSLLYGILAHLKVGERIVRIRRLRSGGNNDSRIRFIDMDVSYPLITAAGRSLDHARYSHSTFFEPDVYKRFAKLLFSHFLQQ